MSSDYKRDANVDTAGVKTKFVLRNSNQETIKY